MTRKHISPRERFEVLRRDGFACVYCGATSDQAQLVIDHIEPVSRGGACNTGNYATACQPCNAGKAARPVLPDGDGMDGWPQDLKDIAEQVITLMPRDETEGTVMIALMLVTFSDEGITQGLSPAEIVDVAVGARRASTRQFDADQRSWEHPLFRVAVWLECATWRQEHGIPWERT